MEKFRVHFSASLLITYFLLSCSSDDGNTPAQNDNTLVGTWQVVEIVGSHVTFGTEPATNVQGTIKFNADGTGKENYSFTVFDVPLSENDNFTWTSSSAEIVTDPGKGSEQTWTRLSDTATHQEARYGDADGFSYTFTLSR